MKKIALTVFLIIFSAVCVFSQMPGWMTIHDSDGNVYFIDGALKIQASGDPEFKNKAIKKESALYYLEQAKLLYKQHHKADALTLLKSIKILSDKTNSMHKISDLATAEIAKIMKLEGERFHQLDIDSSIILYSMNDKQCLISTYGGFEFCAEGRINVYKKISLEKYNYSRDGVLAAVFPTNAGEIAYCLISITSENFHYNLKMVKDYEEIVRNKIGGDAYEKTVIEEKKYFKFVKLKYEGASNYLGYEIFKIQENRGLYVKMIYLENQDGAYGEKNKKMALEISDSK